MTPAQNTDRPRRDASPTCRELGCGYDRNMSRQAIGNALASVVFFIVAIVDFLNDSSGIGVVFLVFAAAFAGLAFSDKK
jgi:hypothetical protein